MMELDSMKMEDTICYNISNSIDQIEDMIKTGEIDAGLLATRLHKIRKAATKMESGLKIRKELMVKAGIEEQYQKRKNKDWIPGGINKVANTDRITKENPNFEFIVKEKGEIIYHNFAHAGAMSIVEKVEDIDETGAMNGQCQHFTFGHILAIWYGFDQLRQVMEGRGVEIMSALKSAVFKSKVVDPAVKQQLLDAINAVRQL